MRYLILLMIFIAVTASANELESLHLESDLNRSPTVLIFVSFSMPKESLKGWMMEAEKIDAPIIIRGLIHNSFKETTQTMKDLIKDNHGGVQLDPQQFKKYQINKVPAVVVTSNSTCLPTQSCIEHYDVVYGNVTLAYALSKIAAEKDEVSEIAKNQLQKLKEKSHV